ncbi:MAG: glycoside hydrolase family 26 protein [Bacteroidales bacterium]|nr:glycoside hydrolase family 26 protein [Bacteroidales bacterium]
MVRFIKPTTWLLAACILTASCAEPAPNRTGILDTLSSAAAAGTPLYGHQDDLLYGHSWNATRDDDLELGRSDVHDVCGQYPAILGLDLGGIEVGEVRNLDGNYFELMRLAAIKHHERGGLVALSWHLRNPLTGGDSWDVSSDQVVASILPGGEKHDEFVQWMDRAADWILSLKDHDGKQIPVLWRPWHEHSGSWFWWGRKLCSDAQYNALWRMNYEYFRQRGIEGLVWAISPNYMDQHFEQWETRYPGDEYVDVIGLDCYASPDREGYIRQMRAGLASLQQMCEKHGKILAVTETGLEGIPDPTWWTGALAPAVEGFPVSYILTWRNASDRPGHYYAPFPGESSAEDFRSWVKSYSISML